MEGSGEMERKKEEGEGKKGRKGQLAIRVNRYIQKEEQTEGSASGVAQR